MCSPTSAGLWEGMPLEWNTSDRQNEKEKLILFVLNNELTWKRMCRCSIYVENIISKGNKPIKTFFFQWIVFSFLFKTPLPIIFESIS